MSETHSEISTGVYTSAKKNGEIYYRSSVTYSNKHISLGSFHTYELAHAAYILSKKILGGTLTIQEYPQDSVLQTSTLALGLLNMSLLVWQSSSCLRQRKM